MRRDTREFVYARYHAQSPNQINSIVTYLLNILYN